MATLRCSAPIWLTTFHQSMGVSWGLPRFTLRAFDRPSSARRSSALRNQRWFSTVVPSSNVRKCSHPQSYATSSAPLVRDRQRWRSPAICHWGSCWGRPKTSNIKALPPEIPDLRPGAVSHHHWFCPYGWSTTQHSCRGYRHCVPLGGTLRGADRSRTSGACRRAAAARRPFGCARIGRC